MLYMLKFYIARYESAGAILARSMPIHAQLDSFITRQVHGIGMHSRKESPFASLLPAAAAQAATQILQPLNNPATPSLPIRRKDHQMVLLSADSAPGDARQEETCCIHPSARAPGAIGPSIR